MNARLPAWCARTWRGEGPALQFIVGAEFTLVCGLKLVVLAATRRGYGELCQLITARPAARRPGFLSPRPAPTWPPCIPSHELAGEADCLVIWRPGEALLDRAEECHAQGSGLPSATPALLWLGVAVLRGGRDAALLAAAQALVASGSASAAWPVATCTCTRPRGGRCRMR